MFEVKVKTKNYLDQNKHIFLGAYFKNLFFNSYSNLSNSKNIIVMKFDSLGLGDIICTFEFFDNLRYYFKNAKIIFVINTPNLDMFNDILNSKFDQIISISLKENPPKELKNLILKSDIIFDLTYFKKQNKLYSFLSKLNKITVGSKNKVIKHTFTVGRSMTTYKEYYLNFVRILGIKPIYFRNKIEIRTKIKKYSQKKIVSLCFEGSQKIRTLPIKTIKNLLDYFSKNYPHFLFIILGNNSNNKGYKEEIYYSNILNLTSKTSINYAISIINSSILMISMDSGLMHVASNFGIPIISISGAANPLHSGPQLNSKHNLVINVSKKNGVCKYKGTGDEKFHCGACIKLINPNYITSSFEYMIKKLDIK